MLRTDDLAIRGPARDFVGYGPNPPKVVWPNGASVAVSIVINYEEGGEYAMPMGDSRNDGGLSETPGYTLAPGYRDLGAESMAEYGARAGVHRVLRLLAEYSVRSTFFATAVALEKNPTVGPAIVAGGHEPCSHGWRWEETWALERDVERERIAATIESFQRTCGRRCVGCYHRYSPSVNTRELLVEEGGFLYDSDSYADDLPYFVQARGRRHLVVPYSLVYNDARFVLAGGFGSIGAFVELVTRAVADLQREGNAGYPRMLSIGLHARLIGLPGRISGLREILDHLVGLGDCWIATREDIARWWIDHHEDWA